LATAAFLHLVVKVVQGYLPDAGEEDLGAVAHLGNSAWQITTFLTRLQSLVNAYNLFVAFSKMAGPHLIINVLVPNARVNDCVALHAAGDLV
jgi:hypothetical protein